MEFLLDNNLYVAIIHNLFPFTAVCNNFFATVFLSFSDALSHCRGYIFVLFCSVREFIFSEVFFSSKHRQQTLINNIDVSIGSTMPRVVLENH